MSEEKKQKNRNLIFDAMVAIVIILFAVAISPKSLQNDTFYTIKIGEYIAQNGISDLTQDHFSWHELPYTYPHWLYDFGMYWIYHFFGQAGIYVSTMIFTAILGWMLYLLCSKFSKNKVISSVVTILAMYIFKPYLAARAQLVTFILFAWEVYSIESFLQMRKKRYVTYLLLIPLLIANLHCAVFPFYFVLFLPYVAEYLWVTFLDWNLDYKIIGVLLKIVMKLPIKQRVKENCERRLGNIPKVIAQKTEKREKRRKSPYKIKVSKNSAAKWLIVIALIAALTGFLNPTGLGAYTYTYQTYQGNTTESINEHLPVTLIESKEFLCALCIFLAILVFTDTKIKLADLFMLGGLVTLSLMSRRQISMFILFCSPILVRLISDMIEKYDEKTFQKIFKLMSSALVSIIIILLFSIGMLGELRKMKKNNVEYVDVATYPVEAATWMLENLDVENMKIYNEYNYGSYLLFRGIPVFIDSRCDLYSPEFNGGRDIFSDALNIAGIAMEYHNAFENYGVTHVISYSNSKLVMLLKEDELYEKLYEDDYFAIFKRLNANEK